MHKREISQLLKTIVRRKNGMKKALMIGLTLLISVAFVTCVFAQSATEKATKAATDTAQEKAKAAGETLKSKTTQPANEKAAAPAPEKKAEKKEMAKAKTHRFAGKVIAMDMAAKTMAVKGKKGDMTFDVATAKMKGAPKIDDRVFVKYTETDGKMVAKFVSTQHHKKGMKKHAAPSEKPVTPEKSPAPAPAPAK
jgi:hypothetical protein